MVRMYIHVYMISEFGIELAARACALQLYSSLRFTLNSANTKRVLSLVIVYSLYDRSGVKCRASNAKYDSMDILAYIASRYDRRVVELY